MEVIGKAAFCEEMANVMGSSNAQAKDWYEAFVSTFTKCLKDGNKVQLVGFMSAEVKNKPARNGINPLTKQKIKIKASKVPTVKLSASFKALF